MNILSILNKTLYLDFISYLFPPSFYFAPKIALPLLSLNISSIYIYSRISLSNCLYFYYSLFSFLFFLSLLLVLYTDLWLVKFPFDLLPFSPLPLSPTHQKNWNASIEFLSFHLWTELNSDYSWEPPALSCQRSVKQFDSWVIAINQIERQQEAEKTTTTTTGWL